MGESINGDDGGRGEGGGEREKTRPLGAGVGQIPCKYKRVLSQLC